MQPVKTILCTGAAGFIGSHLCRALLKKNYRVIGVDNFCCGFLKNIDDLVLNPNFLFIEKDIRYLSAIDIFNVLEKSGLRPKTPIDMCFHLAARGELYWCRDNTKEAVDININGTIRVLDTAIALYCRHFVFADTSAEYDNCTMFPSKEWDAPNSSTPRGIYSITKMAASQFVRSIAESTGMTATILRYFNVYGPSLNLKRDIPPLIGSMSLKMLKGEPPIIYGNGEKRRDFIYISDVTSLHMKIVNFVEENDRWRDPISRTFNVGTGINFSVNEIYNLISLEIFKDHAKWIAPDYQSDNPNEANSTLADIAMTRRVFDWYPKVEIEEGIHKIVESIKSELGEI